VSTVRRAFHRDDTVGSRDRFAASRADLIGDVRGRAAALGVATNIAHDDLGPLLSHQERLAASDSSAAAGDDRNLACQALITGLGHGRFSLSSSFPGLSKSCSSLLSPLLSVSSHVKLLLLSLMVPSSLSLYDSGSPNAGLPFGNYNPVFAEQAAISLASVVRHLMSWARMR